jgi:hypothetical protein
MELVPLKIKILRKVRDLPNGRSTISNDYPDFNSLDSVLRNNLDWCYFVDQFGGWHYDKLSGFGEADDVNINDPHNNPDSTCQYGCFLAPKDFAKAAIEKFPDRVFELNEELWEKFYDDRAHVDEPDEIIDQNVINTINAKKSLGLRITNRDLDALDPDKPIPGITHNMKKRWKDVKSRRKVTITSAK